MKTGVLPSFIIAALTLALHAQDLQLGSPLDPSQGIPAGGGGDSWAPILSAEGRYVLFASTANNLLLTTNHTPMAPRIPPVLNVFLRDRTNDTTSLVSVNLSGVAGGNGDSVPAGISTNGQYVLFESAATDLVAGDTNKATDIFLRDLVNGTTTLISASTNGFFANGNSRDAVMTPDAHYVAFVSAANNLVVTDTNRIADIFVRDVLGSTTVKASVGAVATNTSPPLGSSEAPEITPDGRYVAFYSTATNLVPGVPAGGDVYVRDLVNSTTTWASTGARAAVLAKLGSPNAVSYNHAISADGQFVAYEASRATNSPNYSGLILRYSLASGQTDVVHTNAALGSGAYEDISSVDLSVDGRFVGFVANTNGTAGTTTCLCVWDAQVGGVTFVSTGLDGTVPAYSTCDFPTLSANGQCVAFVSTATNLVTNVVSGAAHLFARDLLAGTTVLVDANANGVAAPRGPDTRPSLSADGRSIAFDEADGNLVPNDRNREADVFVRDLATGGTELISARESTLPTITANGISLLTATAVSADGRYLAFASEADNLVPNDTNACRDIFVRDLLMGSNILVSVGTNGLSGDGVSSEPSISADGRYVAFTSTADSLVLDTNKTQDVFVRDLRTGTTILVSVRTDGLQANGSSYSPIISANGRFVLFRTTASNLVLGTFFTGENLLLRDIQTGATYALTAGGVAAAAMTPDGRFIAFTDNSGASAGKFYIWDTQVGGRISTNITLLGLMALGISPDGNRIAWWSGSGVVTLAATDRLTAQNWTITNGPSPTAHPSLRFSRNGQALAYNKTAAGTNQVYVFDFLTGANVLVSASYDRTTGGTADSDSPDISADGRFIAYRSAATNLVSWDTNGVPDIFLYDRQTGSNAVVSASQAGGFANNRSLAPVFSPDGHTLCFASWASDLQANDFNHYSDVFAFRFLYAMILPGGDPAQGPWLSWPAASGKTYQVQVKDTLADPDWHDLTGTITNQGTKAWLQDASASGGRRFYRILAH